MMPPLSRLTRVAGVSRPLNHAIFLRRCYSSPSKEALIRVTNVAAPGSGHIRVLELNRPSARNAISRDLLYSLRNEVDGIHAQYDAETGNELSGADQGGGPTRALVVASAVDSCFCAGADLKERRGFTPEETAAFLTTLRATFTSLAALPIPTISAISSLALGGGLELALSTHFRVLTSNAVVALPETRLGIIPGAGGTHRLPALVGIGRARDLVLTGRRVSGPEAYFLGIADRLVEVVPGGVEDGPEGDAAREKEAEALRRGDKEAGGRLLAAAKQDALNEAVRLAMEICEGGPIAVRAALQAVQRPHESVENAMYDRVVATEDRNEALKAFGEKRKPIFKGR